MIQMRVKHELFRSKYLNRYLRCQNKLERTLLLTEICTVFGYNRKYAIRKLKTEQMRPRYKTSKRKKPRYYDTPFDQELLKIWKLSGSMCAEHLHQYIADNLDNLVARGHASSTSSNLVKLKKVSVGTIKRTLREYKGRHNIGRGISTTRSNPRLQKQIPIRTSNWDIKSPGWHETDYVSHCGETNNGNYLHTLNFTDIYSGWTFLRALPYANQKCTFQAFQEIESRLMYSLRGINPDNGSEFINIMLWQYYQDRSEVEYTRSRPYKKNDNAVVERKNYTIVRKYTGYCRYENEDALEVMRLLYQRLELFINFFQPTQKVVRIQVKQGKVKTKRDNPQTPFARLKDSKVVSKNNKVQLENIRRSLDPVQLMKDVQKLKKQLFRLRHN